MRTWFDINQAAIYLSVRPKTIRSAILAGAVRRAKLGKRFVIPREDLDAWARRQLVREIET